MNTSTEKVQIHILHVGNEAVKFNKGLLLQRQRMVAPLNILDNFKHIGRVMEYKADPYTPTRVSFFIFAKPNYAMLHIRITTERRKFYSARSNVYIGPCLHVFIRTSNDIHPVSSPLYWDPILWATRIVILLSALSVYCYKNSEHCQNVSILSEAKREDFEHITKSKI